MKELPDPDPALANKPPLVIEFDRFLRLIGSGPFYDQVITTWNMGSWGSRERLVNDLEEMRKKGTL